jgi:3-hydroxybutyryl-CoA dehydrogenase
MRFVFRSYGGKMLTTSLKNIAVVGAGTMGHSIAQVFAHGGYNVTLNDNSEKMLLQAQNLILSNLNTLLDIGIIKDRKEVKNIVSRIKFNPELKSTVKCSNFVIEAIVEDAETKKELFRQIDIYLKKNSILASNTSYLNIFEVYDFKNPRNVIIAHWFNPPHIIPLVEVVLGPKTSKETEMQTINLLNSVDKEVVLLKKYISGFISNRLQAALNLECYHLLDSDIISPQELDKVAQLSFGLRLPFLGVAKSLDFSGLDLVQKILANKSYFPPKVRGKSDTIDKLVASGRLGVKTGKGFYNYSQSTLEKITEDRDLKLIKLRNFLCELLKNDTTAVVSQRHSNNFTWLDK